MNSSQLSFIMRFDECTKASFVGVFPIDHLSTHIKSLALPATYIINTAPSTDSGEHWVSCYFPHDKSQPSEYFDSYGASNKRYEPIERLLRSYGHKTVSRQPTKLQGDSSTCCGQYCLYFLLLRSRGCDMHSIVSCFDGSNSQYNDSMIVRFVNKHFDIDTVVHDYAFVLQACRSRLNQ
jgi:hypothetical protein